MKILQIPNYYKPHTGGIEQTAHDISDSLKANHEVKVICFSEDDTDKLDIIDEVEVTKCKVNLKVSRQALSTSYNKRYANLLKTFKPEVIIFHYPNPFGARYVLKYIKKYNATLIVWFHADIVSQKILGKFFVGQTKKLLNLANKIICTSPIYKETSESLVNHQDKCLVIESCINEERLHLTDSIINRTNEIKEEYKDKIIVFAVGRHVKYKGLEYLVEANKYLNDKYQILIGGSGPLTEELKEKAKDMANIKFLGRISDEDLTAYLNACDIYAFPSITKNEAFGLTLAEAMSFGKPSVTFTIPGSGVNYVSINNKTGIESPNSDSKALADAILKLGEDPNLRSEYGKNAKARVEELFMFNTFKDKINELIGELR